MKYAGGKEYHEFSSVCWPSAVEVARKGAVMVAQVFNQSHYLKFVMFVGNIECFNVVALSPASLFTTRHVNSTSRTFIFRTKALQLCFESTCKL